MLDLLAEADEAASRAATAAGVVIRELDDLAEFGAMIVLFDEIWEPDDGCPPLQLDMVRALTKAGNYAAGAYDVASGELLGACVGFFGPPAHAELHSHIAGVRQAGLGRSVGFALKVHQRAWCLRRDVRSIAWTYDPLIRRNSYFNLVKLGARPVEYLRNFYGTMDDVINSGTETDRVLVRWDLASDLAVEACAGRWQAASFTAERDRGAVVALSAGDGGSPLVLAGHGLDGPVVDGHGLDGPVVDGHGLDGPVVDGHGLDGARTLLVGVPADIEAMRLSAPALASAWRTALRDVLAPLLAGGARVTGFDRSEGYVVSLGGDAR